MCLLTYWACLLMFFYMIVKHTVENKNKINVNKYYISVEMWIKKMLVLFF